MIFPLAVFLIGLDAFAHFDQMAESLGAIMLIAAGVVVYRTFRERYLLLWIIGWSLYLGYDISLNRIWDGEFSQPLVFLTYVTFIVSSALFAAAVFEFLQQQRLFLYLTVATFLGIGFAFARTYYPQHSISFDWAVQIAYRVGTFTAAFKLARFNRRRGQIGPWLMAAMLLFIHIDFDFARPNDHSGFDVLIESLLGLSMLVLVLEESRTRSRRLEVVSEIINSLSGADDEHVVTLTALQQLRKLLHADAAWFRALIGDRLEMRAHSGLPDDFLRDRWNIPLDATFKRAVIESAKPMILKRSAADAEILRSLEAGSFDHLLILPVVGKASVIGTLAIAQAHPRRYRSEEISFLAAAAKQLGTAMENVQLISKILRSQRQWAHTFDALPDPILVHDDSNRVLKANRALLQKLGTSVEQVISQPCTSVLPSRNGGWTACPYCQTNSSEVHETPDPCFGGYSSISTVKYFEENGGPSGTVHIIRDTTARHAAEDRYRNLFEQVQEGVFVSTPDGRFLDCNDTLVRMLGYDSREEILGDAVAKDVYADPRERDAFLKRMEEHGFVRNREVKVRRRDGAILTVLEHSYARPAESGDGVTYHGVLLDITEKKRAEDEVRRRNRELEALNSIATLANHSFDLDEIVNLALRQLVDIFKADTAAVFQFDHDRRTLRRSAAYGHLSDLGSAMRDVPVSPDFWRYLLDEHLELITHRDLASLPPEFASFVDAERLRSWIWIVMWSTPRVVGILGIGSRQENAFSERDETLMASLGRLLANSIEKVRLYEETSKAYDNLRRTQEQLLQSEKMSAVGQLISGVAHELNNPLTAILGYSQLLETENLTEHQQEYVGKLYKQAMRTHRVVQNLLSFARQHKPAKMPVDVRRIVDDTLALRDYDLNIHNIVVDRKFAEVMPAVVADPHQLEQVFLNIINNAVDAMLERDRKGRFEVAISVQNSQVSLEFHDSGPGIKEVNRIFDPFYTTKGVGKGTGLGLSICYGIIKEHGGDIRAHNHPCGGAVLQIVLPVAASAGAAPAAPEPAGRTIPLKGRILLVDDEEAVLDFEREVLAGAGATVVCRESGDAAVSCLATESFDTILLDGTMPGALNGIDVYHWISNNRPELKSCVILTFSSLSAGELKTFVEENRVPYIMKPFEVSELIRLAAEVSKVKKSAALS